MVWLQALRFSLPLLTLATFARGSAAGEAVAKVQAPAIAARPARAKPSPDPRPAAELEFRLTAATARGTWTLRVTNVGAQPVRISADARLLTLEVTPRSARASTRCVLPDDMRPSGDLERALVVPPHRSYVETFEARLYCFTPAQLDALSPGAIVRAKLGWTSGPAAEPPFEVSSVEGAVPGVSPQKWIESAPIALPDEPTAWAPPAVPSAAGADADAPKLTLRGSTSVDAATPNEIGITVTLRNEGRHAAVVRFRPEAIDFDIVRQGVAENCTWPMVPAAPLREMFSTLGPQGSESLDLTLASYCLGHALDRSGLIVVWPRLDTRDASGAAIGMRTFDGQVMSAVPTLVRLHRGGARVPPAARRPELEPLAGDLAASPAKPAPGEREDDEPPL